MHLSFFAAFEWISWFASPANWPTVLAVAGGLGFVIFVHELGHFLVAKACGVKCEKFYLGFDIYGIKLAKFQWGETEYGIGILPLGGYVKMLGQDDNPARMAEETRRTKLKAEQAAAPGNTSSAETSIATAEHAPALTHGDLPPEPVSDPHTPYDPRSYMAQSVPKRMAIISAGVIMNVIFAFLMASLAYGLGVKEIPCIVGRVTAGGAAWKADLRPSDEVIRIGNLDKPRYRDLQSRVPLADTKNGIDFVIKRPGVPEPFNVTLYPENAVGVPLVGIRPYAQMRLLEESPTAPDSAAADAKPPFEPNDKIVKIDDQEVKNYAELQKALLQRVDKAVHVTVLRPPADLYKSLKESKDEKLTPAEIDRQLDAAAEPVEIDVPPTPVRDVGLVMTMGPITGVQKGSPADEAGIKAGDVIVSVNGKDVGNPLTLPSRLLTLAKQREDVKLEVERSIDKQKKIESITIKPQLPEWYYPTDLMVDPLSAQALGVAYHVIAKVVSVVPNSPASRADVAPGDVITKFQFLVPKNEKMDLDKEDKDEKKAKEKSEKKDSDVFNIDEKTPAWPFLIFDGLSGNDPEMRVKLWVKRGDKGPHTVELTPAVAKLEDGSDWNLPDRGFGLKTLSFQQIAQNPTEAFQLGARETVDNLLMVYRFLQRLGKKDGISVKMMSGPVGIAQAAGMKVQEGFSSFLLFLTMLSANLAVVNFLPIPVLDGGHMVFLAYEGIRRKPASERVIIAFTYAGLLFLLTLMLFVLSLDLGWISRR